MKDNTYFNSQMQRFSGERFSLGASYLGQYFIPISGDGDLTSTFSYNLAFEIGQSVTKNLHFNVSLSTGVEAFKPNCCDVGAESFEFQWSGRLNGQLKYYFSPRYMIGLNNDILVVKDNFINRASIIGRAFLTSNLSLEGDIVFSASKFSFASNYNTSRGSSLGPTYRF